MPAPTNLTFDTAIVISTLPYATTQDVYFAGTVYSVWYAFTAPDSYVYGVFGHGDFTDYFATPQIFTLVSGSPVGYMAFGSNTWDDRPIYFPVTSGVTYYIRFDQDTTPSPTAALLTIAVQRAPEAGIAEGDLIVPDEHDGFPAAVISPTTGEVVSYILTIPDSVAGDVRDDGMFLVDRRSANNFELFNADYTLLTTLAFTWTGPYPMVRTCWPSGIFYLCNCFGDAPSPSQLPVIKTVGPDGAFGPTTWTFPDNGLVSMAPSNDETVLYHAGQGLNTYADDAPVGRYDLVNSVMLTDLAAGVTNYSPRSILVLADDTILVLYGKRLSTIDAFVRRYSTAGATLNTYTLGEVVVTGFASNYLFRPVASDTTSFWVRSHPRVGGTFNTSRHTKIQISDGTVLATVDTPEFSRGVMQGVSDAGSDLFGDAPCCPVWVAMEASDTPPAPPGGGGEEAPYVAPSYHLDARYIRRLRRAPHVTNEHMRVFYRRFELDLERGQGLATGQGEDPMVMLRISRDGGQTWGEEQRLAAGRLGAYTQRVIARRLGHARDTVFEIVVSDPISWSLVGAWLDLEPGTS